MAPVLALVLALSGPWTVRPKLDPDTGGGSRGSDQPGSSRRIISRFQWRRTYVSFSLPDQSPVSVRADDVITARRFQLVQLRARLGHHTREVSSWISSRQRSKPRVRNLEKPKLTKLKVVSRNKRAEAGRSSKISILFEWLGSEMYHVLSTHASPRGSNPKPSLVLKLLAPPLLPNALFGTNPTTKTPVSFSCVTAGSLQV